MVKNIDYSAIRINYKGLKDLDICHIINTIETQNSYSTIKSVLAAIKASLINRIRIERTGKNIAFVFSSCYQTRTDHLHRFMKVVNLFPESEVFTPNQRIKIGNIRYLPVFFSLLKSFQKSIPGKQGAFLAFSYYLTYLESNYILTQLKKSNIRKVVVFCDMHPVDNMVVQMCKKQGIFTYTLQHGHYRENSPAFQHSVSDMFLGFGLFTRNIAEKSGFDISRFCSVGMMDLINEPIPNKIILASNASCLVIMSGIIEEDVSLLTLSEILILMGYKRIIKFHPGSKEKDYDYRWNATDTLISNQKTISELFDLCDFQIVAGGSTVFAEGILKLFPSFVYDYKCKRFEGLNCLRFRTVEELKNQISTLKNNPNIVEESMINTRKMISETECVNDRYINAISN